MLAVQWPLEERGGPMLIGVKKSPQSGRHLSPAVRLIVPCSSVHELAVWEKAHKLPGIPFSSVKSGSSAAVERGLRDLLKEEQSKSASLEEQLREIKIQLGIQEKQNRELAEELVRERIPSFDDGVFVQNEDIDYSHSSRPNHSIAPSIAKRKNSEDVSSITPSAIHITLSSLLKKI